MPTLSSSVAAVKLRCKRCQISDHYGTIFTIVLFSLLPADEISIEVMALKRGMTAASMSMLGID